MKRQPTECKETFANCPSDKGLMFRLCKELKNLTEPLIIQFKNGQIILINISQ
jgi:hypothetical protein